MFILILFHNTELKLQYCMSVSHQHCQGVKRCSADTPVCSPFTNTTEVTWITTEAVCSVVLLLTALFLLTLYPALYQVSFYCLVKENIINQGVFWSLLSLSFIGNPINVSSFFNFHQYQNLIQYTTALITITRTVCLHYESFLYIRIGNTSLAWWRVSLLLDREEAVPMPVV